MLEKTTPSAQDSAQNAAKDPLEKPIFIADSPDSLDESLAHEGHGLLALLLVGALAGAAVGLVGGGFHWMLIHGGNAFAGLMADWRQNGLFGMPGWIGAVVIAAVSVGLARWLIRFAPTASGSGVQHVEAVMHGEVPPAPLKVLPIKFIGGLLSMIPGMALGREGPTIQMAAVIGTQCGKLFGLSRDDKFLLYTAVAGSGLSVAFNAPLAGAAFVIEEVARRVTLRRALVTLVAVATAISVYRAYFGNVVDFKVGDFLPSDMTTMIMYAFFGCWMGAVGVLYNRSVLLGLNLFNNIAPRMAPEFKAACIGGLVGALGYYEPLWVGGGELQAQAILLGQLSIATLVALGLVRWSLGPLSYSAGTPGGIFAPLLLMGATVGALFATGVNFIVPIDYAANTTAFALVGMAALFTSVVRAPLTGVLLIVEMSGNVSLIPPLLIGSVASALVATLMGGQPIYDSLRARMNIKTKP
jgi:CIC family chloride channel protein